MLIRQAQAQDLETASELIFSSAANLLTLMFNVTEDVNALAYLKSAFSQHDGQYGFGNHWVIERDNQVVAIASGWHYELSEAFHRATIQSITNYYGLNYTLEVIQRCQVLQGIFPAPQKDDWYIGHFAVSVVHQRQGLGAHLIKHMGELALSKGKKNLTLDVEFANQAARLFYQRLGFRMAKQQVPVQQESGSQIGPYLHMVLPILI